MKILLTHGYFIEEDPKEKLIMKPYPPLGILYISAYLEKNGYTTMVHDSTFSSRQLLKERLLREKPDIVAIYTNLMTKLNVLKIIQFIKSTPGMERTRIILGGPEVRNHKENFIKNGADIIVFGEGEDTMLEIVKAYSTGSEPQLKDIAGIAYLHQDGSVCVNGERTLIREIDQLPMPDRAKIDLQRYFDVWKKKHGTSVVNVSTMRGCPYSCKWCSRAVYGTSYRRRSPLLVADEIEWLKAHYEFDMIWFVDDVFTISHRWLKEFADEMKKRKLRVPYEIITRADRVNEEVVQLLQQSGCFRVWIGAESGSQKIIDAMDRRVKVEQVGTMIRLVKSYGMEAGTFIMLGYPQENEQDIKDTLQHLKNSNPNQYTITVAYPIKGTPLYSEVENLFIENLPWETSTDRDIDFKRTYSRKYYDYAISWIHYEMLMHQRNSYKELLPLKLKALKAKSGMLWERLRA